jgi:acyl-[acyl-carrier-protein]-phospholipid O-acyltransferase / long-chain-fatty-acid--[acyl-carrier-protein] ligase
MQVKKHDLTKIGGIPLVNDLLSGKILNSLQMAKKEHAFELHGKENIPDHGILIIPNRLGFQALLHLDKFFSNRQVVYLIERGQGHDPLLRAHLDKEDVAAVEFTCSEEGSGAFKKELHLCLAADKLVVFVPGLSRCRPGQTILIPSRILKFLTSSGAPLLPLYVDRPEQSCLSTENTREIARIVFSFGRALQREGANLANYTENLLVAAEMAYSNRPILKSHLAYELLKGLKKHGATSRIIDGLDESELRYDRLLAAAIAFSKLITKFTEKKRVGIILPPGKGGLVANLAVLFAGKVPVNLNFTAGEATIESCIQQADLDRFITAGSFIAKMDTFAWPSEEKLILLDQVLPPLKKKIAFWLLVTKICSAESLVRKIGIPRKGGSEEAVLLFTSGSSGTPKGVVLSHRNLLANVNQFGSRIDLRSDDKVLGCLPLFHSFGSTVTMWYPLIEGVNLVTYPSPLDTARLSELIHKYSISLLLATPTFLRGYLRRASPEQLASLKMVVTGAEKLPLNVADSFQRRFGQTVFEGYGLTETSPVTNINLPDLDQSDLEEEDADDEYLTNRGEAIPNHRPGSVGLFIPGVAVRITDPETFQPLPLSSSGMIWLKGPNVFEKYLNLPQKTAEVIINGWFITGDIGRMDEDGFLYIEGRLSRFSKIAGEMVPHETVEAAINQALEIGEDTRKIAIVGVPDEAKGEVLVMLSSDKINITDLRPKLKAAGIAPLWHPKKIVKVNEIPILASGKLDIKKCEEIARAAGD